MFELLVLQLRYQLAVGWVNLLDYWYAPLPAAALVLLVLAWDVRRGTAGR